MLHRTTAPFLLALCAALVVIGWHVRPAAADDGTPTVQIASPEATQAVITAEPPTPALPNVSEEGSPVAAATAALPVRVEAHATPVRTAAPLLPTPVAISTVAPPDVSTYLPSPAELEENARLRWGKRVPASVRRWAFLIVPAARRYHLNPNLVAAVITMESAGDPLAWNHNSDARGLMQVLHGPWDPAQNITLGTSMLRQYIDEFHDLTLGLAAYNAGPAAVLQYAGIPPYRETRDYVIIVRYLYDLYAHHPITSHRRAEYGATIRDLQHFKDQRKKVHLLAQVGHVAPKPVLTCHELDTCKQASDAVFPSMDPFWPMPGPPDPLQHVGPDLANP